MNVQLIECGKTEVPKGRNKNRTFSREFAVKLADSIRAEGMYNPIVVRPNPNRPGYYYLVQGRHRLYAKNVLKERFIDASIIKDMDEAHAEMAMIAENLWRSPLTKPQHKTSIKAWFAHFMARNPDKVGRSKAGLEALAKKREAAKGQIEDADAETATGSDSDQDHSSTESSFAKMVAAATGLSEESVKRSQRIARVFTEDQLEAFTQMSTSQKEMLMIAGVKDEVQRGEVVNLIASGMEAADAIKEVMGDQAPKRGNGWGDMGYPSKA